MGNYSNAQMALYAEIERQTKMLSESRLTEGNASHILKELALAYRLVQGGAQPGGTLVNN